MCKLAKEKGFDEYVEAFYAEDCDTAHSQGPEKWNEYKGKYAAPTQSLLQRWLREEKDIHISINYQQGVDEECPSYDYSVYRWPINTDAFVSEKWEDGYSTYELALEDALKYALEDLV